jgi:hypothetical protein
VGSWADRHQRGLSEIRIFLLAIVDAGSQLALNSN